MNTDPLNELWNSGANQPDGEAAQRLASHFAGRLRRRRRLQAWWLGWTLFALAAVTILALTQLARQGASAFAGQWALLPLLALPWFVALRFLRVFFRADAGAAKSSLPLRAALVAAQASNLAERRRLSIIGGLLVVMLPVVALSVWQLHVGGKASVDQAWSMALVFGAFLALGVTGVVVRYRRFVLPEKRTIEALRRDLEAA